MEYLGHFERASVSIDKDKHLLLRFLMNVGCLHPCSYWRFLKSSIFAYDSTLHTSRARAFFCVLHVALLPIHSRSISLWHYLQSEGEGEGIKRSKQCIIEADLNERNHYYSHHQFYCCPCFYDIVVIRRTSQ